MKPLDILLILVSILFATGVIVDHTWGPERKRHRALVKYQREQLDVIQEALEAYAEKFGRYPSTAEGLEAVPGLRRRLLDEKFAESREFLRQSPAIRTIHGIPYIYENREALLPAAFKSSPAKKDRFKRRRFSREIDDTIFVSSLGLQNDSDRVFARAWLDALLLFAGGVIVFLAIAYAFHRNRKSGDRVRGVNAMIMVGVALLLALILGVSGGQLTQDRGSLPERIGKHRPELAAEYLDVMREFVATEALAAEELVAREATLRAEFEAAGVPMLSEAGGESEPEPPSAGEEEGGQPEDAAGEPAAGKDRG